MTLGKYINQDTFVHRLDPRNKFILLFILMAVVFINSSFIGYAFLILLLLILYKVAKLKISMIFKSIKPMWFMMIFLFVINIFVIKGEYAIVSFWGLTIYLEAILQTLKIIIRLALLITSSTLFTATTKPLDITIAIEDIFSFLKIFHINVHILSMTISIALRFIPTILDETYRIMKAQASRGVDFVNGKLKEKMVAITSLIIPLFISAFSRSDELANAMEARNYNPLGKRSRYRILKWHCKDTISLVVLLLIMGGFITLNILHIDLNEILWNLMKGWFTA